MCPPIVMALASFAVSAVGGLVAYQGQKQAAKAQKKFDSALLAKQAQATVTTAAGEGGVSGLSVSALSGDVKASQARAATRVDRNLQIKKSYLQGEIEATQTSGQSQINSVALPEPVSFLPTLVGIFGSGVNAYSGYQSNLATATA